MGELTNIFDTHAHYDDKAFDEDRESLLESLPGRGIARVVNVGASPASCRRTLELTEKYEYIYGAIGIHPNETGQLDEENWESLKGMCREEKCVAVGEIGLDYYWDRPAREIQKKWFARQLNLAKEYKLPVVIHSRDAAKDTVDIMEAEKAADIGGVVHCFSYTKETARTFLNMGFFFGIGGVATFQNARKLREAVEYIPLDRIVLETDCPYLAPEPFRGKRNDSRNLIYTAKTVAELKRVTPEAVIEITEKNAGCFYRIDRRR